MKIEQTISKHNYIQLKQWEQKDIYFWHIYLYLYLICACKLLLLPIQIKSYCSFFPKFVCSSDLWIFHIMALWKESLSHHFLPLRATRQASICIMPLSGCVLGELSLPFYIIILFISNNLSFSVLRGLLLLLLEASCLWVSRRALINNSYSVVSHERETTHIQGSGRQRIYIYSRLYV